MTMETMAQIDPYDIRLLDLRQVKLRFAAGGLLEAELEGVQYDEVTLYRTYPLTRLEQYISVRNAKGEELGIIVELSALSKESAATARQALNQQYMIPQITHIESIRQIPSAWVWKVSTHLGELTLTMRNIHEHVQMPSENRLLVSDMDGNRCEIADIGLLDEHSAKQLKMIL